MIDQETQNLINGLINRISTLEKKLKEFDFHRHTGIENFKIKTSDLDDDAGVLLTAVQKTDLTDGGTTTLHSHA